MLVIVILLILGVVSLQVNKLKNINRTLKQRLMNQADTKLDDNYVL